VLTDDSELALNIRRFGSLGYAGIGAAAGKITKDDIQDPGYQRHLSLGWNYRLPELCSAVALAQTERIDELVLRRQEVAGLFNQAVAGCSWLRPQATPPDYVHAYWTFAALLEHPAVSWKEFRKAFRDSGGDGVYAAWKLGYSEPVFTNRQNYADTLCPVAEYLQPRLLQFKTNYWKWDDAERQAEILQKTIRCFE
jgi:perosamine synthetase